MPELVNNKVGSLPGTSGAEGTMVWPLLRKNSRKSLRIWEVLILEGLVIWLALAGGRIHAPRLPQDAGAGWSKQPNALDYQAGPAQSSGSTRVAARMLALSNPRRARN